MKTKILLTALFITIVASLKADDKLWHEFVTPPDSCRTKLWWFHGETETTREGIEMDLTEFKKKGIGGVVFYDQVHGKCEGASPSMSDKWWDMLKYAASKADSLGLSFEMAASNGYVAGGPWITPELAMKKTVFIDTLVSVPADGNVKINLSSAPAHFTPIATVAFRDSEAVSSVRVIDGNISVTGDSIIALPSFDKTVAISGIRYDVSPRGKGSTGSMNIPGAPSPRYYGAKYREYPPLGMLEYSTDGNSWHTAAQLLPVESVIGHKSRRRSISFPTVKARHFRLNLQGWQGNDSSYRKLTLGNIELCRRDIIDNIEVKSGLRTEVTYPSVQGDDFGAVTSDSIRDITPIFDEKGNADVRLPQGEWRIITAGDIPTGARTKHGRKNLLGREADVMSAEAATVHYNHYFKAVLDTLSAAGFPPEGMCMDSHEAGIQNWTKGFEHKFRKLAGYGLTPWIPALAGYIVDSRQKSETFLRDFRKAIASTIASEFYGTLDSLCRADGVRFTSQSMLNIDADNIANRGATERPQGEFWAYQTDGNYDCKDAASSAHIYGHPIASCEAFTDTPYSTPWNELLRIAALAWCRGINEFVVCASSYQPWPDHKYDDSASLHPYVFHRFHHEWEHSRPFWDYQARCTNMMRKGKPVVDLCVYLGEEPPIKTFSYRLPPIPEGYNFDVCSFASLPRMKAENGRIVVEGGMEYRVLLVEERTYVSPTVRSKLDSIATGGVPVIYCDSVTDLRQQLYTAGIAPDLDMGTDAARLSETSKVHFAHRQMPDRDIYLIYNHSDIGLERDIRLRTYHRNISIWNPATVSRQTATISDSGSIRLDIPPYTALFIIAD